MNLRLILHIAGPVILTSLLLLAVGVGAAWYVDRFQKRVSQDLLGSTSGLRAGEELVILIREAGKQLDYFLITGERKHLEAIANSRGKIESWLDEAQRWSLTPRETELTGKARSGYEHFTARLESLEKRESNQAVQQDVRDLRDHLLIEEIQQPVQDFLDYNEVQTEQSVKENQLFADRLVYGLLLLGICGSGAGLLAGFGLARGIGRRLVQLSVPIRNAAGRLDEVVGPITFASTDLHDLEGVLHQIAERIDAIIDRLRQSERKVLQAEHMAAVGEMAAGMAHELRNPLTSMKILVQAALDREQSASELDEPSLANTGRCLAGRDLLVLEEEIIRLEKLVQAFLHFARPQVETKVQDVRPLIEQTIGMVAARAKAAGAQIEFAAAEPSIIARVDAGPFRQALLNLLINALDAVESSPLSRDSGTGGEGWIRVAAANGADGWLTLSVSDNGSGIPESIFAKIFDPFVTTKESGLGLGLSICKRIAEAHGGSIVAANRAAGGAEFTVRLPPHEERRP